METIIKKTLLKVFNDLTSSATKFEDWYGYKTAEIKFSDMVENIGIGINSDNTAIKIFFIDKDYDSNDVRRFIQTFRIGIPTDKIGYYWSVELAQCNLRINPGNFRFISYHMQIAHLIIQIIEEAERHIFKIG
ncbi:MAG: hypothetical protein WAZ75_03280 [Candidatus Absconditicoccaceae bacterium]